jgi:hypothetical protein
MKELNQSLTIFFSEESSDLIDFNLIPLTLQSFITLRLSFKSKRGVDEKIFNFNLPTTC